MSESISTTIGTAETIWPKAGLRWLTLMILFGVTLTLFLLQLTLGSERVPLGQLISALMGGSGADTAWVKIALEFRLPKAITAALGGAALAAAGLQMQTLFRNPLAGPWVVGVTAGARFGAGIFVLLGVVSHAGMATGASLGAMAILLVLVAISPRVSTVTLLIVGLMLGFLAEGVLGYLTHFASTAQIRIFASWAEGGFGGATWDHLKILAPVILVGLVMALALVKPLNALLLGERYARSLGLTVTATRLSAFMSTVALSGAVTAMCGPIVFLDVAVPHLCRGLFNTSDHRVLTPGVILMGASVALAADLIVSLPDNPQVSLYLNTVTTLLGAPVVLWVVLRRREMRTLEL
jgi:iron complex transport system permease protein